MANNDENRAAPTDGNNEMGETSIRDLVDKAIQAFANKFEDPKTVVTVSEFIKLLELKKELGLDEPKEITVTWIEPK